jgi:hypothetical protein
LDCSRRRKIKCFKLIIDHPEPEKRDEGEERRKLGAAAAVATTYTAAACVLRQQCRPRFGRISVRS